MKTHKLKYGHIFFLEKTSICHLLLIFIYFNDNVVNVNFYISSWVNLQRYSTAQHKFFDCVYIYTICLTYLWEINSLRTLLVQKIKVLFRDIHLRNVRGLRRPRLEREPREITYTAVHIRHKGRLSKLPGQICCPWVC